MVGKTTRDARHTRPTALRVLLATLLPQFAFGISFAWIGLAPYAAAPAIAARVTAAGTATSYDRGPTAPRTSGGAVPTRGFYTAIES
jgi:hypothetical protein